MTWKNDILDEDFLDHVIRTDYGSALENHRDKILSSLKLKEIVKKTEHDLVTSDDMTIFPENWKDHQVSQLLADMIKESEK